jgi:hypothetical protein
VVGSWGAFLVANSARRRQAPPWRGPRGHRGACLRGVVFRTRPRVAPTKRKRQAEKGSGVFLLDDGRLGRALRGRTGQHRSTQASCGGTGKVSERERCQEPLLTPRGCFGGLSPRDDRNEPGHEKGSGLF